MNELEFMELLSEIPAEYVEAAAAPQKRRRILRKIYGIPVAAACLAAMIAAAAYPRLRTEKPEQILQPDESSCAVMTDDSAIGGTTTPDPGITVYATAYTTVNAVTGRSTTADTSGHTGRTTTVGGSVTAVNTETERPGLNANTTKTTAVHANQGQTTKTTTGPTNAVTTGRTARTTGKETPGRTTGNTARTTSGATTRTTARQTTRPTADSTTRTVTTALSPGWSADTTRPAVTTAGWHITTAMMAATTAPNASTTSPQSGGTVITPGQWGPSGPGPMAGTTPGASAPEHPDIRSLKIIQFAQQTGDRYFADELRWNLIEPSVTQIRDEFLNDPAMAELDVSEYSGLIMQLTVEGRDARVVYAKWNDDGGLTLKVEILEEKGSCCELNVMLFIPHNVSVSADACRVLKNQTDDSDIFMTDIEEIDSNHEISLES